jgi:NAD(P)-dependent dehydrogenase (short-subunit alcohol dehydrogenase family)
VHLRQFCDLEEALKNSLARINKKFVDKYVAKTPLNRMATEEDIVGALIYFASDMSLYTTGQNLIIDGGLSIL